MSNSLVLCGFKGCGKSRLGKELAERLGWEFCDTDERLLEETKAASCAALYREIGNAFYEREKEVIVALPVVPKRVIATGGGSLLFPQAVQALRRHGPLVYLHLPWEVLWGRLKALPAFVDHKAPRSSFAAHYKERLPLYRQQATVEIDAEQPDVMKRLIEVANGQQ
jgi:shikimate kinase